MKRILLFLFFAFSYTHYSFSQKWVEMMKDPEANFYDTQEEFNAYWKDRKIEKGKGYKQFRRWENFMSSRVDQQGKLPNKSALWLIAQEINTQKALSRSTSGNWTPMGPTTIPSNGVGYPSSGIGRINCIAFDPTNSNTIYVGAPSGGLWKSTNAGSSWISNTDALPNLGISSIAIDPNNPLIIYIGTGDADASDTYSYGVLKSTDGGNTWNTTGLSFTTTQNYLIGKVIIDPSNSNTILATTNGGIYRSTNAGSSWTKVVTGNFRDIEFKPGNSSIIYSSQYSYSDVAKVYRSTNNGVNWTAISSALPSNDASRIELAVTAANPSIVYAVIGDSNYGLKGIYKSSDDGATWSLIYNTINILSGESDGSGTGGQAWYDLCIAASPTDANTIFVGGVNIWKSTNGGTSFSIASHWWGENGKPFVHADQHTLEFIPSTSTLFSGNDGGIAKTSNNGSSWTELGSGLQITQFYRISNSVTNQNIVYAGAQDNGTNRHNSSVWTSVLGGDGMECIVDRSNSNTVYASYQNGSISKSTNGGTSFNLIAENGTNGIDEDGSWITPYVMHPTNNQILYAGYKDVWKTTNTGSSWSKISSNLTSGVEIKSLVVAKSDPNYLYAATNNKIFKTTNGGTSWTNITGTLPVSSVNLTSITISPSDPNTLWVTFSGFSNSNKVFASTNGGSTWTNYSTGIPNIPVNCIAYQEGSNDGLYIGTDLGVYYRDNSFNSWQIFMTGLPNVIINELEIHAGASKIRAATYGRGLWESDLYSSSTGPAAIVVNYSNETCNSGNGQVILGAVTGGTAPYTYNFNGAGYSSSTTFSNLSSGTYTLLVKDNNGEIFSAPAIILSNDGGPSSVSHTIMNEIASGSNGSIVINSVTGGIPPYLYNFNNLGFSSLSSYSNLTSGTYTLIIKDSLGCTFNAPDILISNQATPSLYCIPTMPNTFDTEYISNVTIGTINNNSSNAPNTPYEDFSTISTTVAAGSNQAITVVAKSNYTDVYSVLVFVDWNNDQDFDDAGETFNLGTITNSTGTLTFNGSLAIPTSQAPGTYRMRVLFHWNGASAVGTSCSVSYGEFEDYLLNITSSASLDVGPTELLSPTSAICVGINKTISATIKNFGVSAINYSSNNVIVNVTATSPSMSIQDFSYTLNFGYDTTGETTNVILTNSYDMSEAGIYTFLLSTTMLGDTDNSNDTSGLKSITVNVIDNADFSYSSLTYCNNDLSNPLPTPIISGGSYSASPNGLNLTPSTGLINLANSSYGSYTISYSTNGNCPSSSSKTITIFNVIKPIITESGDSLYSSVTNGNQWYDNSGLITGAINNYYTPAQEGYYFIVATDINNCSSTSDTVNFVPKNSNNIKNNTLNQLTLAPNPTSGIITIHGNISSFYKIEIYNIVGKIVFTSYLSPSNSSSNTLNLSELTSGVYFIKISDESQNSIQKIIRK